MNASNSDITIKIVKKPKRELEPSAQPPKEPKEKKPRKKKVKALFQIIKGNHIVVFD